MEEKQDSTVLDAEIVKITFGLANREQIRTASVSGCPISHASQLSNPFLGLPLESGKCESCGHSEPGKCQGHFGYIELPLPIYHPSHVNELKQMLSLLCLKCLKIKNKLKVKNNGVAERLLSSCCPEASQISVKEVKTTNGACYLELKVPSRSRSPDGIWNFLEKYGFRYSDGYHRTLLPREVMKILRGIPEQTRRKLSAKGYFPQDGYVMQFLPVPPNCLSVPDISDGLTTMSSDPSTPMLKKVIEKVEIIRSSRSGEPNFESHVVEVSELQSAVNKYLEVRGTGKASRDIDMRFGINKSSNNSSTKAWLEKMRTLFIRKGSGFSSRSVITGDAYKRVNEIGIPFEIAQQITFEERVSMHNMRYLQDLVDNKLCLTYRDGSTSYSLREGSKGHTFLRPGQLVHRRIMDGDTVFINRPPTTHKHSLQALSVYVHDDHTVKINPLICGPLSADFDGDCVHLFYPQSPAAKAEVLELFSVEKQLLSSHSGYLNLQMATDSLLSLKVMFEKFLLDKAAAQQLSMYSSYSLPQPALSRSHSSGPFWTALQLLQTALPAGFDCTSEKYLISKSEILKFDFSRDVVQSVVNELVSSIFFGKGPKEVLEFFDSVQPLLMENLFAEGFSVGLQDFSMSKFDMRTVRKSIQDISHFLSHFRSTYNEELQLENRIRLLKESAANFIPKSSTLHNLVDFKSDSAVNKLVQQIGFLGLQLSNKGKFYSKDLVEDMALLFKSKQHGAIDCPSADFGFIKSCFFHGLDPYEEMAHSISTREVIVRSSRGLSEPGTLFKNMMAVLRDIIICYDGTIRNTCNNSVIQFEYGSKTGNKPHMLFPAGEPVGVLAATAMSNPAYKAVLDSTPSSNSSWELMKEILLCKVSFKNDLNDRRIILYLNECSCGRPYCQEKAACCIKNQLKKVTLKDTAVEFLIEYKKERNVSESCDFDAGLVGHVHLNKTLLQALDISMEEVLLKCQDTITMYRKKKKVAHLFKLTVLSMSECCCFQQSGVDKCSEMPCLMFFSQDTSDIYLEKTSDILANMIYPVLLETVIKGDPRISSANIIWASPKTTTWIRNPSKTQKGEWVLDVVVDNTVAKKSGDAWRIIMDSCLPVFHLIDTRRSIPYAIKQVQELLGVSCAFEQAVQRLSTSVAMVAKGVLKEHLLLLANSMTCAGTLVGFNPGGYKALSRSMNLQAPFTEATLFTPKKCFERAAEKCHTDNLSSIVGSCSWGKHAAVGTGSRFDILWDTKEAGYCRESQVDVYSFLHMLRSSSANDSNTGCVGTDIDELIPEEEMAEWCASPELNSDFGKPVFEDGDQFQNGLDNQPGDNGSCGGTAWDKLGGADGNTGQSNDWSGWTTSKPGAADTLINKVQEESSSGGWDAWGKKSQDDVNEKSSWGKKANEDVCEKPSWGKKTHEDVSEKPNWGNKSHEDSNEKPSWGKKANKDVSEKPSWGNKSHGDSNEKPSWGNKANEDVSEKPSWGNKQHEDSSEKPSWGKTTHEDVAEKPSWGKKTHADVSKNSSWGKTKQDNITDKPSWGKISPDGISQKPSWGTDKSDTQDVATGWGTQSKADNSGTGWGTQSKADNSGTGWGTQSKADNAGTGWGTLSKADNTGTGWGTQSKADNSGTGWGTQSKADNSGTGWGTQSKADNAGTGWGTQSKADNAGTGWGTKAKVDNAVTGWGTKSKVDNAATGWGAKAEVDNAATGWGAKAEVDNAATGWGAKAEVDNVLKPTDSSGWGANKSDSRSDLPAKDETSKSPAWDLGTTKSSWDQPKSKETSNGWGVRNDTNLAASSPGWDHQPNTESETANGWGTPYNSGGGDQSGGRQWGQSKKDSFTRNRSEGPRGWVPSEEWKGRKSHPGRMPRRENSDSNVAAMYTATRQRLDSFTAEEQNILADVEPLMRSIRRIMHQSGYNDGDPISSEDQSFILDNIFKYHPEKEVKMGAGIDFVTVSKHTNFQDSRCFYIVSIDGSKQDFSTRKCIDKLTKEKYPDLAVDFLEKYFQKPRPRPVGNREPRQQVEKTEAENAEGKPPTPGGTGTGTVEDN